MTQANYPTTTASSDGFGALFDFSFTRFVTISMIKIIYILAIVLIGLGWIGMIIAGFAGGLLPGLFMILVASVAAVLYLLLIRVGLEVIVVVFRIGENTSIMAGRPLGGDATSGFPVTPIEPSP